MGSTTLKSNYKEVIVKFREDYSDLRAIVEISVPNKVHFLQDHLALRGSVGFDR